MWVICEIEGKLYPIKIEVSALPQIWLSWKNGELFCYWPKTNAASKIRSCAEPKSGWNIYKCRLLMRGATFETYEAAIEAERISEGYSTLSAFNENASPKRNNCESKTDSSIGSPIKSTSSYASSNSSVLFSDEELVGNDSFEYNERMKLGGAYLMENENSIGNRMDLQLDDTSNFPEKKIVPNSPQCSDYSTTFANGTGMLTSTLVGYGDSDGNFNASTQITSQIAKIDGMFSSFIKDVRHEMKLLEQIVQVQPTSRNAKEAHLSSETMHSLNQNEKNVPTSNIEILDIQILNAGCDEKTHNDLTNHSPFDYEVGDTTFAKALKFDDDGFLDYMNRPNVDYLDFGNAEKTDIFTKDQNEDLLNEQKVKELFTVTARNAPNALDAPNALNTDATLTKDHLNNPNINANAHLNDPNINPNAPKITLPIKDPDQYKQIEKHFFDEEIKIDGNDTQLEQALIAHLLPLADEEEDRYMDRMIDMVFEENFFLDRVSWKTEPNRINLSARSNVMACWRKSFESKFGQDDPYKAIKRHFRRVKGVKRAALKAKERKLQKLKNKLN